MSLTLLADFVYKEFGLSNPGSASQQSCQVCGVYGSLLDTDSPLVTWAPMHEMQGSGYPASSPIHSMKSTKLKWRGNCSASQ